MVRSVTVAEVEMLFAELLEGPLCLFPQRGCALDCDERRGVYVIYGPDGGVLHVGDTPRAKHGIRQRLRNHLAGKSSFVRAVYGGHGERLREGHMYRYLVVPDGRLRSLLQAYAIGHLCPAHIGGGLSDGASE